VVCHHRIPGLKDPRLILDIGPLVGGFVFASTNWRWTQYVTLMIALAAFLLGVGLPETYNRTILRRRAARLGLPPPKLLCAQSGVTLADMARVTLFTPLRMLVTEPIVALLSVYLAFNFAVLFQWFIAVPAVLHLVYKFSVQQAGLAFIAAILGSLLAAVTSILLDKLTVSRMSKKNPNGMIPIEYRLFPAMIGGFGMTASLFWIGWTAKPEISFASPVVGTVLYVWGSMSTLVSSECRDRVLTSDLTNFRTCRSLQSLTSSTHIQLEEPSRHSL
jgi:MFS transporter, DHA1 family, multidrug resistance protein